MTDGQAETKTEDSKADAINYQAKLEEKEKEIAAVHAKNQELLTEKKRIAEKIEEAERKATEEKNAKLAAAGKFEELHRSAQEEKLKYQEMVKQLKEEQASEKTRNEAMRLATELADGHNAELLTEFIVKRIKYNNDGLIRILNSNGEETVSTLEDLKREFETSPRYKALLRGSKASGGGAQGSGSGSSGLSGKVVTRSVFATWSPKEQMKFMTSGGKTTKG
jgi:hypothetical protein